MTDQPELQQALIPLAEAAGVEPFDDKAYEPMWRTRKPGPGWPPLPGADGTLTDAECWVVLGWLAKAEYVICILDTEVEIEWIRETRNDGHYYDSVTGVGVPLNAALAAAVKALHNE